METKEIKELKSLSANVLEVVRLIESGTGSGDIPKTYKPLIKELAEKVNAFKCKTKPFPIKIFLEDDIVTARDMIFALSQGCKIKDASNNIVWLNSTGELCSTVDHKSIFDDCIAKEWRVVGEYDWYKIGCDLADGRDVEVSCMCKIDNKWFNDEIVGFAPKLNNPFIGATKRFYSEVIILSSSEGYELPIMEVS